MAEAALVALLSGDAEARQRAYAELGSVNAVAAAPAVLDALVDGVLLSAQVEAAEYRQCATAMADLMLRESTEGGGFDLEIFRQERWIRAWESPAFLAVAGKPAAQLTRDDALTVACNAAPMMIICAKGWTKLHASAGEDELASLSKLPTHPLFPERAAANPGSSERLTELVLEICRDPQGVSDRQLASLWFSLFFIMTQRPELAAVAAHGGIFDIGTSELREFGWRLFSFPISPLISLIFVAVVGAQGSDRQSTG